MDGIKLFSRIYLKLILLALSIGALLRIVLLFNAQTTDLGFSITEWFSIFIIGAANDLCVITIGYIFMWFFMTTITDRKYAKPWNYILLGIPTLGFCYVTFCHTIFDEYGSVASQVASIVLAYWAISFALRLFIKSFRRPWTTVWFGLILILYVGGTILNGICEYVFWSEFGVRYNFIAVDYLVYTNEVIGNIMESYPVIPLSLVLALVTLVVSWYMFRNELGRIKSLQGLGWKITAGPVYLAAVVGACYFLSFSPRYQTSANVYVNELQANGIYRFYDAFVKNELNYNLFYLTLPDQQAAQIVHQEYGSTGQNCRQIAGDSTAHPRNIVLITIESMSADFMEHFGNTNHLTPNLDSLYNQGIAFERVFATGNRTVRGLEAVTLALPPCPGQSIIKRPNNGGMHSTGEILRRKGYSVQFFYGGRSYFDNMSTFFEGNGYEVIDQTQYTPDEISFANIWGVCDQDAYRKVIRTLNQNAQRGQPFFAHIMSISNHRPFTYPEGQISIPADAKSRDGGVMYSDHALGEFLREARRQPWFDNTVFLITADHCASSAGKTEIPLAKYHIPAVIYAPALIAPASVAHTVSQIDLMPTLFSLINMGYESHFFGRSVFEKEYRQRAFIATYQDLGYLEDGVLTILSPVRRYAQFHITPTADDPYNITPLEQPNDTLLNRAISFYQTSSAWNNR